MFFVLIKSTTNIALYILDGYTGYGLDDTVKKRFKDLYDVMLLPIVTVFFVLLISDLLEYEI
jgi:hypothetical protein